MEDPVTKIWSKGLLSSHSCQFRGPWCKYVWEPLFYNMWRLPLLITFLLQLFSVKGYIDAVVDRAPACRKGTLSGFLHWKGTLDSSSLGFLHWKGTLDSKIIFIYRSIQKGTFCSLFFKTCGVHQWMWANAYILNFMESLRKRMEAVRAAC